MDLKTVRNVKRELETVFAKRGGARRKFALGVATPVGTGGYRVAVRAAAEEDLPETSLKILRRRTAGEVDVQFIGEVSATGAHSLATSRGPAIGASIAHPLCTAGTLGFFARRLSDGCVGFVSNNHVLAAEDRGQENDEIFHPAPIDCERRTRNVIGHLAGGYPRLNQRKRVVDCAFARLVDGLPFDAVSLDDGRKITAVPTAPDAGPEVCKLGRTTGLTHGRISAFEIETPQVHYSLGLLRLENQIEIESTGDSAFSKGGDSGSLVFTRSGCHPVGLVFAASAVGGYGNRGVTYANPIDAVLLSLGVTFLT